MKIKFAFLLISICSLGTVSKAQEAPKPTEEDMRKIKSAYIALVTERLELSPKQAEKFWPIYNEYVDKRQALKSRLDERRSQIDPKTASEEEKRSLIDLHLKLKEQEVDLERTYSDRMMRVISPEQLIKLRSAEEDFRRMLLERLQNRRKLEQRQRLRNRVDDRNRNKRN